MYRAHIESVSTGTFPQTAVCMIEVLIWQEVETCVVDKGPLALFHTPGPLSVLFILISVRAAKLPFFMSVGEFV